MSSTDVDQGEYFTMKLPEQIDLHDRVVCADSWFTSLHLIKSIKDRGGHFVGTIAEKPYLPSKFVAKQGLQEGESLTVFNHEARVSLTYKKTHKTKSVRVISDMHNSVTKVEETKSEPNMFYNGAKSGVDGFDKMCASTSTSRKTSRWPQCLLYGLINIVMNNAFIIHKANSEGSTPSKMDFFMTIAWELARPQALHRYQNTRNLTLDIKWSLYRNFRLQELLQPQPEPEREEEIADDPPAEPVPQPQGDQLPEGEGQAAVEPKQGHLCSAST